MSERELEWHRVFEATTMGLKFLEDGELKQVKVNGKRLCLARRGDCLYALQNRCPHAGGPLAEGFLDEEGHLTCPWHRFRFDLETGKNVGGEGYFCTTYPVEIREEGMFVGMEKRKRLFGLF